eukprot:4802784-Prymnesium_polylepis.1
MYGAHDGMRHRVPLWRSVPDLRCSSYICLKASTMPESSLDSEQRMLDGVVGPITEALRYITRGRP